MKIAKPRIKLLIAIAASGLIMAGGLSLWLARYDKNGMHQPTAQPTITEGQSTAATAAEETTPAATTPGQNSTSTTKKSATTTPAPANIKHPTASNCPAAGEKITVYASIETGTPAYLDHPIFRDHADTIGKVIPYKEAITSLFCDEDSTALFQQKEKDHYFRFNFSDVSTTLP